MSNTTNKFDVTDEKDYFVDEAPTVPMAPRVSTVDDLRAAYERDRVLDPCERPTKDLKTRMPS
jgi:hypothetical protein